MKLLKNKLLICNILLCLTILLLIGTTVAYFSDKSEFSNTLTAGNVSIKLTEAAVKRADTGNLVEDTSADRIKGTADAVTHDYGVVFPGQEIYKDPTVENVGSEDAWIAAEVVFNDGSGDLHKIYGYEGDLGIDIELILTGGLLDEKVHVGTWNGIHKVCYNDNYAMAQVANPAENEYAFYFFFNKKFASGDSATLFDTLYIDDFLDGNALSELRDLKITVRAFGVQTGGFETCFDAMTTAFSEYFYF